MKKPILILLSLAVISTSLIAFQSSAAPEVNTAAVNYLKTQDQTAWITMALAAAGESNIPTSHLTSVSIDSANEYAKTILAITALGEDPTIFGNVDYVAQLKTYYGNNQFGAEELLNDDIWSILALASVSQTDLVEVTSAKNFLITNQNDDGGWSYAVGVSSDSNDTAAAIMALLETGLTAADSVIANAVTYLRTAQNDDGGFTYDPNSSWGTASDAGSDSWIISALYKLGQDPLSWDKNGNNPITHLKSLQASDGGFWWVEPGTSEYNNKGNTADAVIALAGKFQPINKIAITPKGTFSLRIEGQSSNICYGQFPGPTALDIVKNASSQCGFTYIIEDTQYGPYLKKINNEEAAGQSGWLYFVNYESSMVGAADYNLEPDDKVLWYYGDWGWYPLQIEVNQTEVTSGGNITATIQSFNNSWQVLESAIVKTGTQEFITNSNGQATLSLADGYYHIYAAKDGYVPSNRTTIKFGEPQNTRDVNLQVNITDGSSGSGSGPGPDPGSGSGGSPQAQGLAAEISFSIDVESVDFGNLAPGQVSTRNINISNDSSNDIYLETVVSGADVFQDNLYLNSQYWEYFHLILTQNESQETELKLSIPTNYSIFGPQTGAITFWAVVE